jgi:hypothetical protein
MRTGKLTALEVARAVKARKAGMLNDGGGLYLKSGSSWIHRYALNGRKRDLGLGPALDIGLADARGRAAEARRLRLDGRGTLSKRDGRHGPPLPRQSPSPTPRHTWKRTVPGGDQRSTGGNGSRLWRTTSIQSSATSRWARSASPTFFAF